MRLWEMLSEGLLSQDAAYALPATYIIPTLQNQDPYKQYRFGVAIAKAKGQKVDHDDQTVEKQDYKFESVWGENQVIVSYSNTIDQYIDAALKEIGLSANDKRLISTDRSEERPDVNKNSPVAKPKRNQYGV